MFVFTWQLGIFLSLTLLAGVLYRFKKMPGDLLFFALGAIAIVIGLVHQRDVVRCFFNETVVALLFLYLLSEILFTAGIFRYLGEKILTNENPSSWRIALFSLLTGFFDQRQILPVLFSKIGKESRLSWSGVSYLAMIGSGMTVIGSVGALFIAGYVYQVCQAGTLPFLLSALIAFPLFLFVFFLFFFFGKYLALPPPERTSRHSGIVWPNSSLIRRHALRQTLLPITEIIRRKEKTSHETLLVAGDYLEFEDSPATLEQRKSICCLEPYSGTCSTSGTKRIYFLVLYALMIGALLLGIPYILATLVALVLALAVRHLSVFEVIKGVAWERILLAIAAYLVSYSIKNSGLVEYFSPWIDPLLGHFPLYSMICFVAVSFFSILFPPVIAIALLFPLAELLLQNTLCPLFIEHKLIALPFILGGAFPFFSRCSSDALTLTLPLTRTREWKIPLLSIGIWLITALFIYGAMTLLTG